MIEKNILSTLKNILSSYPEIIAVYLFGSCLENKEQARDVDLAVLSEIPINKQVNLYLELYPRLAEVLTPLEVDLLFLKSASLTMQFEVISQGRVIHCSDDDRRTDFEYLISGKYMDFKYHLETARQELYEVFREGAPFV